MWTLTTIFMIYAVYLGENFAQIIHNDVFKEIAFPNQTLTEKLQPGSYQWTMKLNSLSSEEEIYTFLGMPKEEQIALRNEDYLRSAGGVLKPIAANCAPEPRAISVRDITNTQGTQNIVWWPTCIKLNRCGGCCGDTSICVPTQKEDRIIWVLNVSAKPPMRINVTVEEHTKCGCSCGIQKEHCYKDQDYDEQNCLCKCRNQYESQACNGSREWNAKTCKCECRVRPVCTTGQIFNESTCSCVMEFRNNQKQISSNKFSNYPTSTYRDVTSLNYYPKRQHSEDMGFDQNRATVENLTSQQVRHHSEDREPDQENSRVAFPTQKPWRTSYYRPSYHPQVIGRF